MNRDLFLLYIHSNRVGVLYFSVVTFIFIYARFTLKAVPATTSIVIASVFLVIALLFLIKQQTLYKETIQDQEISGPMLRKRVTHIALNKLGYMIPWLTILCWPLNSPFLNDHLVGYAFIFCALSLYAATSASFMPLFLWDLAIQVVFATLMVVLNHNIEEIFYVSIILTLSFCFSLFLGFRTNQASKELVVRKHLLENAKKKAESVSQAKSDFLAVMSHEVRTPLTGILGMTEFLRNAKLTDEQLSYIDTIQNCSKILLKTLNDALDLSKVEAGKMDISYENYDLHQLLDEVIRTTTPMANDKGLKLVLRKSKTLPVTAFGDLDRLRQVLLNLMSNALKFTKEGSVTLQARLADDDTMIRFDIIDTGIGISETDQKKLFKKFSQIKQSIESTQIGSGLGLSITKHLIELMQGRIQIESNVDKGSRFWFVIPYEPFQKGQPQTQAPQIATPGQSISVLIVEDNPVNQMVAEKIFTDHGHDVTLAGNAADALKEVAQTDYDLVLMDINLPDMEGTKLVKKIRAQQPQYIDIPVLAVTANIAEATLKEIKRAGMDGYIAKPYEMKELLYTSLRAVGKDTSTTDDTGNTLGTIPEEYTKKKSQIKDLIDEFGIDYTIYYAESCIDEINKQLALTRAQIDAGDMEDLSKTAHDLKSLCGSLDMNNSALTAESVESLIEQGFHKEIPVLIDNLHLQAESEINDVKTLLTEE